MGINGRATLRVEGEQPVVVVAGLPVHHYGAGDSMAEAYAMVFLVDSGFAQQNEIALRERATSASQRPKPDTSGSSYVRRSEIV